MELQEHITILMTEQVALLYTKTLAKLIIYMGN